MIDIKIQVITKQALGFSKKLQGLDFASIAFYRRHTPDGIAICRVNEACLVKTSHCVIKTHATIYFTAYMLLDYLSDVQVNVVTNNNSCRQPLAPSQTTHEQQEIYNAAGAKLVSKCDDTA